MKRPNDEKAALVKHLKDVHDPQLLRGTGPPGRTGDLDLSYERYLSALVERELQMSRQRRLERQLRDSRLPPDKDLTTLDMKRTGQTARQVNSLLDGSFVNRLENLLAFGTVGGGKTHFFRDRP